MAKLSLVNKNLLTNGLNQILGVGFPIVIQYYLIRHLALEDLGYWNIINSAKAITLLFIGFFNIYLIKSIAETDDIEEQKSIISNSIVTMYVTILVPIIIFLFYMLNNYNFLFEYVLISTVSIVTSPLASEFYFQAKLKNTYLFYRKLATRIIYLAALFFFVKDESDFLVFAYLTSLSMTLEHLLNVWFIRGFIRIKAIRWDKMKKILVNTASYLPFVVTYNVMPNLSIVMGDYFLDIQKLAIISVLFKLVNLATTFITSAVMVLFPHKISTRKEQKPDSTIDRYLKNTILVASVIVLGLVVTQRLIFFIFLEDNTFEGIALEYSVLCVYVIIHSIYNYLAYNYYLVDGKPLTLVIFNVAIVAIFLLQVGLSVVFQFELLFSVSVISSTALVTAILWFRTFRGKGRPMGLAKA